MDPVFESRVRKLNSSDFGKGPIIYWMSRDQRVEHNWALLYSQKLAFQQNKSIVVVFTLDTNYPGANLRHYSFMLDGLKAIEVKLREYSIGFKLIVGNPVIELLKFCENHKVSAIVSDFDPLLIKLSWKQKILEELTIPVFEVDTHNIVPCWQASDKEEYSAFTFRKKIKKILPYYLQSFPEVKTMKLNYLMGDTTDWVNVLANLQTDSTVGVVPGLIPGFEEAQKKTEEFLFEKLSSYSSLRNNATIESTSGLSVYLHYGHISAQWIVEQVLKVDVGSENTDSFLDELIVRRELSDNFCFYNKAYASTSGFRNWAKKTLDAHKSDIREFIYTLDEFENAKTHDKLWNAAQNQMKKAGLMHGYLRMYWAKKLLEWTPSPDVALMYAIYLNDKYSLDGRDPNGYAGCAWSIGGVHDRPWFNREVFGQIRFMNENGCRRKFDVDAYILYVNQIGKKVTQNSPE